MNESRWQERRERREKFFRSRDNQGQVWGGVFLLLMGAGALAKNYVFGMNWLFSWQMFLIVLGLFIGLKNGFRGGAWLAMILIGIYFLLERYFMLDLELRRLFWPLALIALGAYLIFRPKRKISGDYFNPFQSSRTENATTSSPADAATGSNASVNPGNSSEYTTTGNMEEEVLDVVTVFSAVKKNIYSKNFRGGEIVSVFGGAEINLIQANFQQPQITIESVQVFGGAKLIVPADWVIHNEAVAIFGGIEDKRPQPTNISSPEKVLVLKGFVMFGGIEIKSF